MSVAIVKARSFDEASGLVRDGRYSLPVLKAGGMDVIDHMKEGLYEPDALVNIRHLRSGRAVEESEGGRLRIAAMATLSQVAADPLVLRHARVIAQAVGSAATPQVRNQATCAGNLLQRPRCWYYRNDQFDCLKKGGPTCYAVEGENKFHAIFGGGPCHIVHPSNLAVALHVTGATLTLTGGDRASVGIRELFHLPSRGLSDEHNLRAGEVVTGIEAGRAPMSGFYAVKEKQSFDWPLVMAAVSVAVEGGRIASARVCAGAVAPVPWALPGVEAALQGVAVDDEAGIVAACAGASEGARAMSQNAYKVKLLPVCVKRAVLAALA